MISKFANMPSLKALFWNASADKKQRKRGGRRGKKKPRSSLLTYQSSSNI